MNHTERLSHTLLLNCEPHRKLEPHTPTKLNHTKARAAYSYETEPHRKLEPHTPAKLNHTESSSRILLRNWTTQKGWAAYSCETVNHTESSSRILLRNWTTQKGWAAYSYETEPHRKVEPHTPTKLNHTESSSHILLLNCEPHRKLEAHTPTKLNHTETFILLRNCEPHRNLHTPARLCSISESGTRPILCGGDVDCIDLEAWFWSWYRSNLSSRPGSPGGDPGPSNCHWSMEGSLIFGQCLLWEVVNLLWQYIPTV